MATPTARAVRRNPNFVFSVLIICFAITSCPSIPRWTNFIRENREERAKPLAEQEAHPTLFADLK